MAKKRKKKLKPSYRSIRIPMPPPSRTIDSKKKERVRNKQVDIRRIDEDRQG